MSRSMEVIVVVDFSLGLGQPWLDWWLLLYCCCCLPRHSPLGLPSFRPTFLWDSSSPLSHWPLKLSLWRHALHSCRVSHPLQVIDLRSHVFLVLGYFFFSFRLFGLWSFSSHSFDRADVRARLSVFLACHFSWPPSSWRGFLLLVASESVPDIVSGRMWGPLSPIVLWLLRSMISVDTFLVTVLGPPVLTDLRYRASCFVAVSSHYMDQTLLTFLLLSTLALFLVLFTFLFFISCALLIRFHTSFSLLLSFLSISGLVFFSFLLYFIYHWSFFILNRLPWFLFS